MISIIICSPNDARFAKVQQHYQSHFANVEHEIIRIPDAKSMCEGYNRGVGQSRGDLLIFSHDDVQLMTNQLTDIIQSRLQKSDMIGVAGTLRLGGPKWVQSGLPYAIGQVAHPDPNVKGNGFVIAIWAAPFRVVQNIQALDGVWFCCKRDVALKIPFDEQTFTSFHHYDLDFTFRAHLAGYKLAVCNDLYLVHESWGAFTGKDWEKYAAIFMHKHAAALSPTPPRDCQIAAIRAATLEDAKTIMTPPWWDEIDGKS